MNIMITQDLVIGWWLHVDTFGLQLAVSRLYSDGSAAQHNWRKKTADASLSIYNLLNNN